MSDSKTTNKCFFTIGADGFNGDYSYCLTRNLNGEVEIILSKTVKEKTQFKDEVMNLAKYFNASIILDEVIIDEIDIDDSVVHPLDDEINRILELAAEKTLYPYEAADKIIQEFRNYLIERKK